MSQKKSAGKPGRPRSRAARESVLSAAREILLTEGLGRLSIERVAARAGVGKPTIYRSWANAHELAMAALMAESVQDERRHRGSAKKRLAAHLNDVVKTFSTPRGRQITIMLASAEEESEISKAFRNQVILQSRDFGRDLLKQAIADGEVRSTVNVDAAVDALYGPIFFRLLLGHSSINDNLAETLVDMLFGGISEAANAN